MVEGRAIDLTSGLEMVLLFWLTTENLREVKEHWNTHRIRGSRHDSVRVDQIHFVIFLNFMGLLIRSIFNRFGEAPPPCLSVE